ncbi:MAG: ERF family protein [Phascolarctobacterium sp.]|nr:ERF family protein [Phascolarctobacterium sp.]
MGIYEKLMDIQGKLKAPKNQYNEFSNFYYRSCEDILESVKPLLQEAKVVLVLSDEVELVGERTYVVATAKLVDAENGDAVECQARARETASRAKFDDAQLTGAASTYARKYALNGLFCIDDGKDPDTEKGVDDAKEKSTKKVTAKQIAELQVLAKKKGVPIENIISGYKLNKIQDIDLDRYNAAMKSLAKRPDAV